MLKSERIERQELAPAAYPPAGPLPLRHLSAASAGGIGSREESPEEEEYGRKLSAMDVENTGVR
jgi:hypothetical protein